MAVSAMHSAHGRDAHVTFWRHTIEYHPVLLMEADSEESVVKAGIEHHVAGRLEQAIECYRRGIAARPDWHNAYANLSIALLQMRRVKEAIDSARMSVRCCPEVGIG